jgi:hypothetical protein
MLFARRADSAGDTANGGFARNSSQLFRPAVGGGCVTTLSMARFASAHPLCLSSRPRTRLLGLLDLSAQQEECACVGETACDQRNCVRSHTNASHCGGRKAPQRLNVRGGAPAWTGAETTRSARKADCDGVLRGRCCAMDDEDEAAATTAPASTEAWACCAATCRWGISADPSGA